MRPSPQGALRKPRLGAGATPPPPASSPRPSKAWLSLLLLPLTREKLWAAVQSGAEGCGEGAEE